MSLKPRRHCAAGLGFALTASGANTPLPMSCVRHAACSCSGMTHVARTSRAVTICFSVTAAILAITGLLTAATAQQGATAPLTLAGASDSLAANAARNAPPETPLITHQIQVQDIARLEGHGTSILRGIGIVTGLRGTGDSGGEEVLARPLREIYKQNEIPLGELKALSKAKSAAIVFLEVVVPPHGAHRDDELPVYVTVSHSASSLAGGRLHLAALAGPRPGDGVYAMASGPIILEETANPTAGIIRKGARIIDDILMPTPSTSFNLILQPQYRRYATAQAVASVINSVASSDIFELERSRGMVAMALDHSMVRITIPESERVEPARFVARVLSATLSPELLMPPATVRMNQRAGTIIATANVEISPAAISHGQLQIQTVLPEVPPTPVNPKVTTSRWTGVATTGKASERAKLQDLLAAFKQLDVPIEAQMEIIYQLHNTGRLHAELVFE